MLRKLSAFLAPLALAGTVQAQDAPDPPFSGKAKAEVVATLGEKLRSNYVFPQIAESASATLARLSANGKYDGIDNPQAFADALRGDLREAGNDRHLQVRHDPSFREMSPEERGAAPSEKEVRETRRQLGMQAFGIHRVARLPGNVGYLDVRFFGPTEFVAPGYEAAMQMLSGMSAIIIDLRSNGGGDPASVAQLASHFFAQGDERHLNSIYNRVEDTTRDFWTVRSAAPRYTGPVFVVTSDYTFSGGEELAYDLQTQERATLVGETTGGGANPGEPMSLGHGFYAFIPTGRAINPVTGKNWEHVGVEPDHPIAAEEALVEAYRLALVEVARNEPDAPTRAEYEALAKSELSDIAELPRWKHPRE